MLFATFLGLAASAFDAALLTPPAMDGAAAAVAKPLLWLPLGDSITFGCGTDAAPRASAECVADAGGYRVPMAWALSQAGYDVTTMGTLTTGPSYVPSKWLKHDGHPGWRFDQIDALLNKSLATSPVPPDLITVHLGTNDCGQKLAVPTIEANANSLLTHIYEQAPRATVYMASMIGFPGCPVCSEAFNALVPGIVAAHKSKGMEIYFTPMEDLAGICVGNTTDARSGFCCSGRVHPTAAGYLRMASAFVLSVAEGSSPV